MSSSADLSASGSGDEMPTTAAAAGEAPAASPDRHNKRATKKKKKSHSAKQHGGSGRGGSRTTLATAAVGDDGSDSSDSGDDVEETGNGGGAADISDADDAAAAPAAKWRKRRPVRALRTLVCATDDVDLQGTGEESLVVDLLVKRRDLLAAALRVVELRSEPAEPTKLHAGYLFGLHELRDPGFYRALVAEFLATVFFVGFSILGILSSIKELGSSPIAVELIIILFHILLLLIVIYAFAPLSGAHFNPATTIAVLFSKRVTLLRAACYVLCQLAGAITGAGIAKIAVPGALEDGLTVPELRPGVSTGQGVMMEFFITFGLIFGAFATAFDPRGWGHLGPVALAVIVGLNIHAGIFVTGACMNPARAFGPAVIENDWKNHWVYWIGPLSGAVVASVTYEYLFMKREHHRVLGVPSLAGDNHTELSKKKGGGRHHRHGKHSAPAKLAASL